MNKTKNAENSSVNSSFNLMGHHIAMLANHYWDGISFVDSSKFNYNDKRTGYLYYLNYNGVPFADSSEFPNKDTKFAFKVSFEEMDDNLYYGKEVQKQTALIHLTLIKKPDTKIKIVGKLDSICLANCGVRTNECSNENGPLDTYALKEYNLKLNNIYTAEDLMDKIKNYPLLNKNRWASPTEKFRDDERLINKFKNLFDR